jgi:hypothetical protein
LFPLCRHRPSPPLSPMDTAFYLNHLSSFWGTLYSLRCAPAFGSSSGLALDAKGIEEKARGAYGE